MEIPIIELSGTPHEMGYEYGRLDREGIRKNFQFYTGLWKYFGGQGPDQIFPELRKFTPYIAKVDPGLIEEMKGVAEGAAMSFEEILALNCRYELSFGVMVDAAKASLEGCTSFALTPESTKEDHTFVGQNWDNKIGLREARRILRLQPEGKPEILIYTEAGVIGNKGLNSAGIGVCVNFMWCEKDTFKPGLPVWLKMRALLNCNNLVECLRILTNFEGPNSINLMIAHREGEAMDAECAPHDTFLLYPQGGILTHSNHFLSPALRIKDTGKNLVPDSLIRSHRAHHLFQKNHGYLDVNTIQGVMKDHFGFPNSICRHEDEALHPYERWESLTSMIMDLTAGEMFYTVGPPCTNSYENIKLKQPT